MNKKTMALALLSSAMLLFALSACAQSHDPATDPQQQDMSMVQMNIQNGMNWFGGPVYTGDPALKATAALVRAGGGAKNFSFAQALVAMLGQNTVNAELAKLRQQYGADDVKLFVTGMDFAIKSGLQLATQAGITLPQAPANLKGVTLAKALIKAGTGPNGTFWSGHLFDVALSHQLHNAVMGKIEAEVSHHADKTTHKILNQAMYDVAQVLGMHNVKLAPFH